MIASTPTLWTRLTLAAVASALVLLLILMAAPGNANALGQKPDLTVIVFASGSDPRPVVAPGLQTDLIVSVSNMRGDADAHKVVLSTTLPKGLKFVSSDPPPAKIESGNRLIWEVSVFPAKALPRLFDVIVEGDPHLAPGSQVEISADATSDEKNADSKYNHDTYTLFVQQAGPALVFTGSNLDSLPLTPDSPVTFMVELKNAGNLPATGTSMKMSLRSAVKFDKADPPPDSSSGQDFTFKLGDLARDESRSVTVTIELDPQQAYDLQQSGQLLSFDFEASRIASGKEITDSHFQPTKRVEAAGQNAAVWLTVEGAKEPGEVSPRDDVTCVITYANLGNQPAHKAVVTLNLGAGLATARSDPRPSGTLADDAYPGGVSHWDIGDLDIGQSGSIRSIVHVTSVDDDGALVNASITADGIDTDTSNNTASLLWHSPLPPGTLKSMRRTSAVEPVGESEEASVRPASHRLRHLFELILLIVVVLIIVRARRNA